MINSHNKKAAIIWMHGRGDKPASWQSATQWLCDQVSNAQKNFEAKAICPAAPLRYIQQTLSHTTAWFNVLYDRPRRPGCQDDDEGLLESAKTIHSIIDNLIEKDGVPSERIFVCGFSQGATTAIASTYSYKRNTKLGGCVALSGWCPLSFMKKYAEMNEVQKSTPLFWGHGTSDDIVVVENLDEGMNILKELKIENVIGKKYEKLGHDTNEDEFDEVLTFIATNLGLLKNEKNNNVTSML